MRGYEGRNREELNVSKIKLYVEGSKPDLKVVNGRVGMKNMNTNVGKSFRFCSLELI